MPRSIAGPSAPARRIGGRAAADDVGATPFGRPEDIEVGRLANGHQVIWFTATAEQALYAIEELGGGRAIVRLAANEATPRNRGYAPTTARLNAPDNLAQDALGNLYIVEDAPNGGRTGGDIWFVQDVDGDGVAESLDRFMSLRVAGAENTGMIFDPVRPTRFVVDVQHPASTDRDAVPGGLGDAVWFYDLRAVRSPACPEKDGTGGGQTVKPAVTTCGPEADFIERLIAAGRREVNR